MKEKMSSIKTKILSLTTKYRAEMCGVAVGLATAPANVYAGNEAVTMVLNILDVIVSTFPAIGIVIALVGGFKLFMAFRNDQPDAYSGAAKDIVVGVILIVFDTLIWKGVIRGLV